MQCVYAVPRHSSVAAVTAAVGLWRASHRRAMSPEARGCRRYVCGWEVALTGAEGLGARPGTWRAGGRPSRGRWPLPPGRGGGVGTERDGFMRRR